LDHKSSLIEDINYFDQKLAAILPQVQQMRHLRLDKQTGLQRRLEQLEAQLFATQLDRPVAVQEQAPVLEWDPPAPVKVQDRERPRVVATERSGPYFLSAPHQHVRIVRQGLELVPDPNSIHWPPRTTPPTRPVEEKASSLFTSMYAAAPGGSVMHEGGGEAWRATGNSTSSPSNGGSGYYGDGHNFARPRPADGGSMSKLSTVCSGVFSVL